MANLIITKDRFYNQKPSDEHAEIDYGNPLSRGLVGAWIFNGKNTTRAYNLCDERISNVSGANIVNTQKGEAISLGTSKYVSLPSRYFQTVENFSIAWMFRFSAYSQNARILEKKNSFSDIAGFTIDSESDGNLHFWANVEFISGIQIDPNLFSANLGRWYSIVLNWRVTDFEAWSNGIYKGLSTTGSAMTVNSQPVILSGYSSPTPSSNWFTGDFSYLYTWKRKLNNEEAVSLHRNPYNFLLPSRKKIYFIIGEAGGGQSATTTTSTVSARFILGVATASFLKVQSALTEVDSVRARFITNNPTVVTSNSQSATTTTSTATGRLITNNPTVSITSSTSRTVTTSSITGRFILGTATAVITNIQSRTVTTSTQTSRFLLGTATATIGATRNATTTTSTQRARFILGTATTRINASRLCISGQATARFTLGIASAITPGSISGITVYDLHRSKMEKVIVSKSKIEKQVFAQSELN